MANSNTPIGLQPIKNLSGEPRTNFYYIPSSYGTALFIGDPVVKTGTSNTTNIVAGQREFNAGTLPEINRVAAGAGNPLTGVIIGFLPNYDDTSKNFNPASTEAIAIVADDPNQLFEMQEESAGTPLAATSVGLNANVVYAEAGSTITGFSGAEIDTTTPDTTQNFQLKILRLIDRVDNAVGQHAKWLVKINQHTESDNTAGI